MEDKSTKFLKILNQLPEEVSLYFSSSFEQADRLDLSVKYGLSSDDVYDIILDYFVAGFKIEAISKNLENHKFNANHSKEFIVDFLGKIFLPLEEFLKLDIKKEIEERGGRISDYKKNINNLERLIEGKNFDIVSDLVDDFLKDFDPQEEERVIIEFLGEDLLEVLLDKNPDSSQHINGTLIYLLINNPDVIDKFSRAFLSNKELISSQRILIDNKEQDPSIANWITHFIKENGSDMPSSISLAKYLSSSPEVLKLDSGEKSLLKKVLRIYRDLTFFPDSMTNVPQEDWKIIPSDIILDSIPEKKKVIKKVSTKDPRIEELEKSLSQYPDHSLEKMAIEDEIKKLSQKE